MLIAAMLTLLGLATTLPATAQASDQELLAQAESAFARGVEQRGDAVAARVGFAEAAHAYDTLWLRGYHNPRLALNRARSHWLAGNLPHAIAALHDGLAITPYDRSLQAMLADARAAVAYPHDGQLAAICRPIVQTTIRSRMSAVEAWLMAGLLWLSCCLALARLVMTRNTRWLIVASLAGAALMILGGLWWRDRHLHDPRPGVIVRDDIELRTGNGSSFPLRLPQKLPRGVEARELSRRGGWVQMELASGIVGWVPEDSILTSRTN